MCTGILIDGPVGISNMTISKNHIHDLLTNVADVVTGIDLYDAVSVTVVNNFVSLNVPTSTVLLGIIQETDAGSTVKIYYNTVSIYGTTSGGNISFALLKNYFSTGDEFRNNILSNTRLSSGTGAQYAIGNVNSGTFTSNYNDLVSTGNPLNVVGRIGATNYATITEWRTATGQDINSVSVAPVFVSATNLHLVPASNPGLDNLGIALAGFTTDYDGETRNATTPDMGADEFTGSGGDVTAPTILYTPLL